MFRIIFVLDILDGKAVHAIRGERTKYQPIKGSRICDSSNPLDIISALSPKEVYIADLDRLQNLGDNFELISEISEKVKTMVDIGINSRDYVEKCAAIADNIILGTETASLELLEDAVKMFPGRINVSIDMKKGKVHTKDAKLNVEPEKLIENLNNYDIKDIIVLELTKVGTSAGIDAAFLQKIAGLSKHDILVGGGIKDMNDIEALIKIGIDGALVATAVHNGKISVQLIR
jgi:phosphoribosylformimino-5-aminoimidazole carboxamide ribotide isomerase